MGKPKKNAKTGGREIADTAIIQLGKKVRYIGSHDAVFTCDCSRSFKKGMISEYKGKFYCSEDCIRRSLT